MITYSQFRLDILKRSLYGVFSSTNYYCSDIKKVQVAYSQKVGEIKKVTYAQRVSLVCLVQLTTTEVSSTNSAAT